MFLIIYLFLQNIQTTLIPTITIPIILLKTFTILTTFNYSINTLTIFKIILTIKLLINNTIIIIKNIKHIIIKNKLPPKKATKKSISQIQNTLINITIILSTIFIPITFFNNSTKTIYHQFSITIISTITLSILITLILTPTLYTTLLKPISTKHHKNKNNFFN